MLNFFNTLKTHYLDVFYKYIDFQGKATVHQYWYFVLANLIVSILFFVVVILIKAPSLINLYILALLVPSIAVSVRRLNDANKSPWNLLLIFTGIGSFYVVYLLTLKPANAMETTEAGK